MFEHLDDPQPPPAPERVRAAVHRSVRRRRRRRASILGGVAVVAGLGGAAVVAARDRMTPEQVEVGGLASRPDDGAAAGVAVDEPMTYLLVGTDRSRPGEVGRADTIVLARVDPRLGELRLVPVPRDLLVAWDGEQVRISALLEAGGPTALVSVVDDQIGVPVHHYVEVDLVGAVDLVDAVGGIRVAVDRPVRDERTGLALGPGCHDLDGQRVLALGRSRFLEYETGGGWRVDPTGDRGRQQRATVVAGALLQALGRIRLPDLPAVVRAGLGAVSVDDSLEVPDVVALAERVDGYRLVATTLPVDDAVGPDGADVLTLGAGASDVVAALQGPSPTPEPGQGGVRPPYSLQPC